MTFYKFILAGLFLISFRAYSQVTYDLTVVVTNLENNDGVLQFGLYHDADKFPIVGETFKVARVKMSGESRKYVFKSLPKGSYALAIYQDENNNSKCDKNFVGVPIEPYAFSNDFRPKLFIPKFKECSFVVDKSKTVRIKLVY